MAHIYTNHGEPETLQGTPEHEWAGLESPDGQEAWKVTAAAAGGFKGELQTESGEKTGAKILRKLRVVHS